MNRDFDAARTVSFGVSANVTIDLLVTYLQKHALTNGQRALVQVGRLDDHVGNVRRFKGAGCDAIVFLDLFDAYTARR